MKVARTVNVERMRRYRTKPDIRNLASMVRSLDKVAQWLQEMEPKAKVAIIEGMGFTPIRSLHQPDCPAMFDSGNICACVPDPTCWMPPEDVCEYRHETWPERLAAAKRRSEAMDRC
jgi:hypothetical protein